MTTYRALVIASLIAVAGASSAATLERDTVSFGAAVPDAKQVEKFLFPEAECEHAKYACMAVRPATDRSVGLDVRFATGSAELTPTARAQLESLGKVLSSRSGKLAPGEIVIEGHADARGGADFNKKLSEQRAESVVKHLVSTYGVDAKVLRPVGRGKDQLRDPERPDSEINRRVEMVRKAN